MNLDSRTIDWLALWLVPGVGPKRIRLLLEEFGSLAGVLDAPRNRLTPLPYLKPEQVEALLNARESDALAKELELLQAAGIRLLDQDHPDFPSRLREIHDCPPVLYQKGEIDWHQGLWISFVGSRKASFGGKNLTRKCIEQIAAWHPQAVIVSGLALGIDGAAHQAALEAGLKTVAVLAGGLSDIYPPAHRELAQRVAEQGALITEFPMLVRPVAGHFPLRNRIISGLSSGVVVVEAGERSGATITAGYALEQGKELFAFPGPADSPYFMGTNRLIQKGHAKLVLEAADIMEELRLPAPQSGKAPDHQALELLSSEEERLLSLLALEDLHQDELSQKAGLPVHQVLALLTGLEMKGLIQARAGSLYHALSKPRFDDL